MTQQLFYKDPYLVEFDATIQSVFKDEEGYWIELDQTAFYPGGGGQAPDRGLLNEFPVIAMKEEGDRILHGLPTNPGWEHGERIRGRIDWKRRFRGMQAHTAQHLISGLFFHQFHIQTVSIHFGEDYFTIEFDAPRISRDPIDQVIQLADEAIRNRYSTRIHLIPAEEMDNYPIRRYPPGLDVYRILEIEGVDWSACGGLHVNNCSEIQTILFLEMETIRKRMRLHFTCGTAVRERFERQYELVRHLKQKLTCGEDDIPDIIDKNFAEIRELKREVEEWKKRGLRVVFQQIKTSANHSPVIKRIPEDFQTMEPKIILQELQNITVPAILYEFDSEKQTFAIVSNQKMEFRTILADLIKEKKLSGGGNDFLFQGKFQGSFPEKELVTALTSGKEET